MSVIAPNFMSVRLLDDDKVLYSKTLEAVQRDVGIKLSAADMYRLAMKTLAAQYNIK